MIFFLTCLDVEECILEHKMNSIPCHQPSYVHSRDQSCNKLNVFNMCNLQFKTLNYTLVKILACLDCSHDYLTTFTI